LLAAECHHGECEESAREARGTRSKGVIQMATKTLNLTGKDDEIFGTVTFDEGRHCWHMAADTEPGLRRAFPSEEDAFSFWSSRFDPTNGCLRRN